MGMVAAIADGMARIRLNINPAPELREYRELQQQRDIQRRESLAKMWLSIQLAENLENLRKSSTQSSSL